MKNDRIILAIETAVGQGSVSILLNGETAAFRCGKSQITRSTDILKDIEEVLSEAKIRKSEIDSIAVSTGPGSLTGARIGVAAAKGLSLALNCQCIGIPVLKALELTVAAESESVICAVISAGRSGYCFQFFTRGQGKGASESRIFTGDAAEVFSAIEKIKPAALIGERQVSRSFSDLLTEIEKITKVIYASDNLSEYIGRGLSDGKAAGIPNPEIEPIYVLQDSFTKIVR